MIIMGFYLQYGPANWRAYNFSIRQPTGFYCVTLCVSTVLVVCRCPSVMFVD